jgi:hypothetical protein
MAATRVTGSTDSPGIDAAIVSAGCIVEERHPPL